MAHRMVKHSNAAQFRPFPPEADGDFPVVPQIEIAVWREKLNAEFGIGQGKIEVVEDPFATA